MFSGIGVESFSCVYTGTTNSGCRSTLLRIIVIILNIIVNNNNNNIIIIIIIIICFLAFH